MENSELETNLWPVIFKTLSDKIISYAVTPNTYPKEKNWKEHRHHEISIMLEDPERPHKPGGAPLFSCWIVLKQYNNIHISIDLSVSLPKAVDIHEILAIMGNEYFHNHPKLIHQRHPELGLCYTLDFEFSILSYSDTSLSFYGPELQKKINLIDEIVHTLYIIEKNPKDKKALTELTDLLLETQ